MKSLFFLPKIFFVFIFSVLFFFPEIQAQEKKMRVTGTVVDDSGRPVTNLNVYTKKDTEHPIGATNDDGKYSVLIERNGTLIFSSMFYKEQSVSVKGRSEINVRLKAETIQLQDAVVTGVLKTVKPLDSDMSMHGNYMVFKVGSVIPKNMLKRSDRRFVFQPVIRIIDTGDTLVRSPMVFDMPEYAVSQERMYDFNIDQDPLAAYRRLLVVEKDSNYVVSGMDSIYVEDPRKPVLYSSVLWMGLENYRKILEQRSDTTGHGVSNPLVFLQYDVVTSEIKDSVWIPQPMPRRRNDKQELHLTFLVGQAVIDDKNPQNAAELDRLGRRLSVIENNPEASLDTFFISGVASPDGPYQQNLRLANLRARATVERLLRPLHPDTRRYLKEFSDARVEKWEAVVQLLEQDSLLAEASEIRKIVAEFSDNPDMQSRSIQRLPYYKKVISETYLPKLRKVEASYSYVINRKLNDQEILALYHQDYKELDRYEFYRLSQLKMSEAEREKVCRQALEVYPDFLWMANKLTILTIQTKQADPSVLRPFFRHVKHGRYKEGRYLPREIWANQITALLEKGYYTEADSVMSEYLTYREDTTTLIRQLEAMTNILNGRVASQRAYDYFTEHGGINEVVMLLFLMKNDEAYEKAKLLPTDDGRCLYVRAIAASRMGDTKYNEAQQCICNAIMLEPALLERAKVDREVRDFLQDCM